MTEKTYNSDMSFKKNTTVIIYALDSLISEKENGSPVRRPPCQGFTFKSMQRTGHSKGQGNEANTFQAKF
jgi:hypothetical protein